MQGFSSDPIRPMKLRRETSGPGDHGLDTVTNMSDDTPWQPPSSDSGADPAEPQRGEPGVSPWSREGAGAGEPVLPEPEPATAAGPPPAPPAPEAVAPNTVAPNPVAPNPGASSPVAPIPAEPGATAPTAASGKSSKRRPVLVALAACAVVAIGLAAIFAVRQFNDESAGGAGSPEELADQMMASMEGEDVLGLVDLMLPGERESLGEPMIDTVAELQRLEILSSDLDLGALDGFDVVIEQHTTEVEQLGVDDIVMLHMSADALVTIDGDEIPMGALITDRLSEDELAEMRGSSVTESDTLEMSMAAVEHDGAWYLSLLYTAAEAARTEAAVGAAPSEGIGAVGADSPEGVVDLFAEHLAALDVRGMLQMLDPAEAEALQRYAPLFLADAEQAIAEESDGVEIRLTETDVRVEGDGSARTLFVDAATIEASYGDDSVRFSFEDDCITVDYAGPNGSESAETCLDPEATSSMEEMTGVDVPESVEAFVTAFTEAFSDMEAVGLEVRERDGQWYVSPIATGSEAMLAVLRALDRDELDELIDLGTAAVGDFFDMAFGLVPGVVGDDDFAIDQEWTEDGWVEDDWADDDWADDGSADDWEYEESAADRCYSIDDATEATMCFETEIAAGNAEDWEMPVSLLAPECGLTELLWSGEVYSLSDDEFTAAMTGAAPCYEALVADGYDEWLVPYEVDNVECFEGRNPYSVFDEEYGDRVFDCAFAADTDDA